MAYMPSIVIGLGGTGIKVVELVRQHVLNATDSNPQLQQRLVDGLFQFLAVDTTRTVRDRRAMPEANYHAATIANADGFVEELSKQDPFFGNWWYMPPNWSYFYKPGPILLGAGAVPVKGRLAYYADLTAGRDSFTEHLKRALVAAKNVWDRSGGEELILVYLVGSLCGGTGSGLFLSIAHHVHDELGDAATIIGVLASASVLNLVVADKDHMRANCCAGLNALDVWLDPDEQEREQYLPFFVSPPRTLQGRSTPIDVCYLITQWNNRRAAIGRHLDSYVSLMADGIFSEIMGPASSAAQESFINFVGSMKDEPSRGERPVHYASFGVSGMRYNVDRITEYLATRFSRRILDEWFLSPSDVSLQTTELARRFMEEARIREREMHDEVLDAARTERDDMVTPAPLDLASDLMEAERGEVEGVIHRYLTALDQNLGLVPKPVDRGEYVVLADVWQANLAELRDRAIKLLDSKVAQLLAGSDDGFEVASNFIRDLTGEVQAHREDIELECEGDAKRDLHGFRKDLDDLKDVRTYYVERILEAYDKRLGRPSTKKREFNDEWWAPWRDARESFRLRQAAISFYDGILAYLGLLDDGMTRLRGILTSLRDELQMNAPSILGQRRGAYVLEEEVLNSADRADEHFLRDKNPPSGYSVETLLGGEGGVIAKLRFVWDLLSAGRNREATQHEGRISKELHDLLMERATKEFRDEVARLSLWDALILEADFAGHVTPEARRRYVERKIRETASRCAPAWVIDEAKARAEAIVLQQHGELSFDEDALARFQSEYGDLDLAALVRDETGRSVSPVPSTDPHAVTVRLVEGRVPLYMLEETKELVAGYVRFQSRSPNVPLYVDARLQNSLPLRLLKAERGERRLVLLMAEFLSSVSPGPPLDDLKTPIQAEQPAAGGAYWWAGDVFARSRTDAYDKMQPHEEVYKELYEVVREVWNKMVTPTDREATFGKMARWFERRRRQRSGPIRKLLKSDVDFIRNRAELNPNLD